LWLSFGGVELLSSALDCDDFVGLALFEAMGWLAHDPADETTKQAVIAPAHRRAVA